MSFVIAADCTISCFLLTNARKVMKVSGEKFQKYMLTVFGWIFIFSFCHNMGRTKLVILASLADFCFSVVVFKK